MTDGVDDLRFRLRLAEMAIVDLTAAIVSLAARLEDVETRTSPRVRAMESIAMIEAIVGERDA